ncbi:SDR family oxidoreductase [Breoghania sp. L-A4]|uniref:SDR family oxidoreductase n=1 Tax=Breoghania sp. L-A4 TaxID=2304600 RepID=UPI000E35A1EB|nr:SDR family oxidoreductase [Breoghania sp. L-A4]AXS39645.1 SDR family oxidoreductase [Breoghania sp. L-A4]
MTRLNGKSIIITGASSGIGHAAALLFAENGGRLVLGARRQAELDALVAEIRRKDGTAIALAGDVRDETYAKALVDLAQQTYGGLDAAFNNAGTLGEMGAAPDLTLEGWEDTLRTNLTSAFLAAHCQIPALLKEGGGALLFTSSFVGSTVGFPGMAAYAASKAGIAGLAMTLAAEFGPQGIRVNTLLPGGTDTDMGRVVANTPETQAFVQGLHALKRTAQPAEIAQAALFLLSDDASFVTGQQILADGGVSITRT